MDEKCGYKTPTSADSLEQQIIDPSFPKNEREWWASAEITRLRAEVEALRAKAAAFDEWHAKTEWVQTTVKPRELGLHRADAMRMRIEALQAGLDAAINAARAAQGVKP